MQLIPLDFAKEMVRTLMPESAEEPSSQPETPKAEQAPTPTPAPEPAFEEPATQYSASAGLNAQDFDLSFDDEPEPPKQVKKNVNVQPAQFQSFDDQPEGRGIPENISLIQDVPLKVTVELGRTVKKINEVLEFGPGTIVELDRIVGEPLDIMVNGQYVAKGEVVVIDENYGIRITDIVNPNKRFTKI